MWILMTGLKEGWSGFFTVKSCSPSVLIHFLFKRKSQYLFSSIDKHLLGLSRILLQCKIFYSSHLLNFSLISVWSYKYLFYTLDYNQVILFCCSNCPSFSTGSPFSWFLCLLTYPISGFYCFVRGSLLYGIM